MIATGHNSCDYIFDSSDSQSQNQRAEILLQKLEEFVDKDESLCREDSVDGPSFSLLSGSLSMALCCIPLITEFLFFFFLKSYIVLFKCASFVACVSTLILENLFYVTLNDWIDIQRVFRSGPLHPHPRVSLISDISSNLVYIFYIILRECVLHFLHLWFHWENILFWIQLTWIFIYVSLISFLLIISCSV